MERFCWSI